MTPPPRPRPTRGAALVCGVALCAAACATEPWSDPARGEPFVPAPVHVRHVGRLFEDASPRVLAASGGASLRVDDEVLWSLRDVVVDAPGGARTLPRATAHTTPGDWAGSDGFRAVAAGDEDGREGDAPAITPRAIVSADGGTEYRYTLDDVAEPAAAGPWVTVTAVDTASGSSTPARQQFRAGPGGLSVSHNEHLGGYLAVYAWPADGADGAAVLRVFARSSRAPDGPWTAETLLFETNGPHGGGATPRGCGAREHPHLARDRGRIIFVTVDGGPHPGTPRMWRVEFPEVR